MTLDPRTGRVHWITEPCGNQDGAHRSHNRLCLGSLTSIQLLRQQSLAGGGASAPTACRDGGVGFSLDPDDPQDPLGTHFRKRFYPEECADLWSDLLPGAVLFQADWDLKRLLHNVDGVGDGLGAWYKPVEAWYREDAPEPLGKEVLAKVWLVAEAVEAAEAPLGLALGDVTLRLRAAAVRRDPASPTGLTEAEAGQDPPPRAVARFVAACNAHMGELSGRFPSFGYLRQLVLAQEAARFLRARGVALQVDPGLAALRSPLTGATRVPALQVERTRRVEMAGVVGVGGGEGEGGGQEEAAVWLRGLGPVSLGAGSRAVVGLYNASSSSSSSRAGHPPKKAVYAFSCGVRNATLAGLGSLDALFGSGAAMDCRPERGVFDPFSFGGGARPPTQAQGWGEEEEEEDGDGDDEGEGEEGAEDGCEEALAVWSEQLGAWRVWPSRPLPPPPPTATNELVPVPLAKYNATGRLVLLREEGREHDNDGAPVVLLAWTGQAARVVAAARRLNATAVLLVKEEAAAADAGPSGGGRRRRRRGQQDPPRGEFDGEEDAVLRRLASRLPVRLLAPEAGEELRAVVRLSALEAEDEEGDGVRSDDALGLRAWLACGVERRLDGEPEEEEEAGPRTVVVDGVEYRTLDLAPFGSERRGCQTVGLPIPEGFEIAPAFPDVVARVVKAHPWATAALLLRATDPARGDAVLSLPPGFVAFATAAHGVGGRRADQRLEFAAGLMVLNASDPAAPTTYRPLRCDARVLLRRAVTAVGYAGFLYRALDEGAAVDGTEVPAGAPPDFAGLAAAAARVPAGWELSPADRGIAQRLAAAHPWGTDVLILADGKGYPTQLYYHRKAQHRASGAEGPLVPHHRVLIRRPLAAEEVAAAAAGVGAGVTGQEYRVADMYRADASARLLLRRLGKGEGERGLRYLLEMEVTERIMIHGGVDLSGVQRVPLPGAAAAAVTAGQSGGGGRAGEDAELLVALERATAEGLLGKDGVWREGDRAYSVVSVAGLDDGEEEEEEA